MLTRDVLRRTGDTPKPDERSPRAINFFPFHFDQPFPCFKEGTVRPRVTLGEDRRAGLVPRGLVEGPPPLLAVS